MFHICPTKRKVFALSVLCKLANLALAQVAFLVATSEHRLCSLETVKLSDFKQGRSDKTSGVLLCNNL